MINLRLQFKTPSFGPFKFFVFVFHKIISSCKKRKLQYALFVFHLSFKTHNDSLYDLSSQWKLVFLQFL